MTSLQNLLSIIIFLLAQLFFLGFSDDYGSETSFICDNLQLICSDAGLALVDDPVSYCGDKVAYPNPEICNCGVLCLDKIKEGEECVLSFQSGRSTAICGYGLDCLPKYPNETVYSVYTCQKNTDKECIKGSVDYETAVSKGVAGPGMYNPSCDDIGAYAGKQCSPGQTCYCVDTIGERLFGETLTTESENTTCACARFWKGKGELNFKEGPRCLSDGSFDSLQCYGNRCYCYDESTKTVTYGPYSLSMIMYLKCFNNSVHSETYFNACEEELNEHDSLTGDDENVIIIGDTSRPTCDPDGFYTPLQKVGKTFTCVNKYGDLIEDFEWNMKQNVDSKCYCARRRYLMSQAGFESDLPECCFDGSFNPIQARGMYSYCVDENGNQEGAEVHTTESTALKCNLSSCGDL